MTRDHMMGFHALASLIAQEQPRPARVTPQRIRLTAEQQEQRRALDVRPPAAPAADGWIEWNGIRVEWRGDIVTYRVAP